MPQGLHNHLAYTIWSTSVVWPCLQNAFMMAIGSSILQSSWGNTNSKFSPGYDRIGEQSENLSTEMFSTEIYVLMKT